MNSNEDKNKKRKKKRLKSPYKPHKTSQEITINENNNENLYIKTNANLQGKRTQDKTGNPLSSQESDQSHSNDKTNEQKDKDKNQSEDSPKTEREQSNSNDITNEKLTKDNGLRNEIENQDDLENSMKESSAEQPIKENKKNEQSTNKEDSDTSDKSQKKEEEQNEKKNPKPISASLHANIRQIKDETGGSQDIVVREVRFGEKQKLSACFLYTQGLTDSNALNQYVLEPLMIYIKENDWERFDVSPESWFPFIQRSLLPIGGVVQIENFDELFTSMLSGEVVFLLEGSKIGYRLCFKSWKDRGVPETEGVVRGPRESFSETMRTNTALVRRKINSPRLRVEGKTIGGITKTEISIMFIDGLVDDKVLDEVHKRLDGIEIDGILESGYIEELIQDEAYSPFPTLHHTEKPDVVAAALLEGRVAIIVDGTPIVLVIPALFNQFFQAAEDYYERSLISSLIRILRFICLFISLLAPAVYIAVTTFHQEMLPTPLLVNLMVQREAVPFPAFIEAFMMELMFEILMEAGVRLPKAVGQTVSFVGALVVGQAAVEAGIVSAGMVIVVAITAISSFVIPAYNMSIALRILRFILMMIAAGFGLYGVMLGIIVIVLHLCSIRSFGIPYMTPYGPYISSEFKDSVVRMPHWMMDKRPTSLVSEDVIRGNNSPPTKQKAKGKSK